MSSLTAFENGSTDIYSLTLYKSLLPQSATGEKRDFNTCKSMKEGQRDDLKHRGTCCQARRRASEMAQRVGELAAKS